MNGPKIGIILFSLVVLITAPLFTENLFLSGDNRYEREVTDPASVGAGATEKPVIDSDQSGTGASGSARMAYISPNLDGVQDNLLLPLHITDDRYITSYSLTIRNEKGAIVRSIKNKETRPETANFGNLIQRFFRIKEGLKLPKLLVWDGRNDEGSVVADGLYNYEFTAADDNNNSSKTAPRLVMVDTKIPVLKLDAPQSAFAPGGDRSRLLINQSCDESLAPIDKWDAAFFDLNGHVVRSWT